MTLLLQNLFILFLTPLSRITGRLSERSRAICIQIVCILFPTLFLYLYTWGNYPDLIIKSLSTAAHRHYVGCFLLFLLIVFSINRTPQRVKWNKWIIYPMVICGLWMTVISFIHQVGDGYRIFALMLIIGYPCLYFVWINRGDYEKLFDPFARALSFICLIVFVYCFHIALKGNFLFLYNRCAAMTIHPNLFCFIGMFGSCGALYMLTTKELSWIKYIFYSIVLGSGYAIVLMGESRTSFVACVVCFLVSLLFYYRYCEKSILVRRAVKLFITIDLVIIMIIMSHVCIDIQKTVELQETGTPVATEQITPNTSIVDRLTVESGDTADSYSSGRIRIWKAYAQFFNLTGNDITHADWDILTPNGEKKAHNNFIEMSYRFGVPLGILFIIIEIIACLKALQFLFWNHKRHLYLLMPIMFVAIFLFMSMLDVATLPFQRDAPCYFYIAIIPMADVSFSFDANAWRMRRAGS